MWQSLRRVFGDKLPLGLGFALGAASLLGGGVFGKPVRVIVPFAAGGGSDTLARILVREINGASLDQSPWVVVNIPGGGGTIGSRHARKAHPNGNTLLFLHDGILTAQLSGKTIYGPDSFEPVAMTGRVGMTVCVEAGSRFETLPDLLRAAETEPDSITFAANIGAPSYFLGKLLESKSPGSRFRYVQSGGGARRFADLIGGHIDVTVFSVSEYKSFRDAGLRALAYFGEDRHPAFPRVPTAREKQIEIVYENLQGWWAPPETPPGKVRQRARVLELAMSAPGVVKRLEEQSIEPVFHGAGSFGERVEKKHRELAAVSTSASRFSTPRFELFLAPLSLILLTCLGLGAERRNVSSSGDGGGLAWPTTSRLGTALLGLGAYLAILAWFDGWFLPATALYLFGTLRFVVRPSPPWPALVGVSVLLPVLLYLFVERLLGLPLP